MTQKTPEFQDSAFTCPHCGTYAAMDWFNMTYFWQGHHQVSPLYASKCRHCDEFCYWLSEVHPDEEKPAAAKMILPQDSTAPPAHPEMPADARRAYEEARIVLNFSPGGAALLLRAALGTVCQELGSPGRDPLADTTDLVAKGLPAEIPQALKSIDTELATAVGSGTAGSPTVTAAAVLLFEIVNLTVAEMIAKPRKLRTLCEGLPKKEKNSA